MKRLDLFLILFSCFCCRCMAQNFKQEAPTEIYTTKIEFKKTKINSDAFSFLEIPFMASPDSVPCIWDEEYNELFLNGFAVDYDETFYFAGGRPTQIAAFKGNKLIYRKELHDFGYTYDLFHLHNDSLYIVDAENMYLWRMHKNGGGEINKTKLELDFDRIDGGWFYKKEFDETGDEYILGLYQNYKNKETDSILCDNFSTFRMIERNNIGGKHTISRQECEKLRNQNPFGFTKHRYIHYAGRYKNSLIYIGLVKNGWEIVETDEKYNIKQSINIPDIDFYVYWHTIHMRPLIWYKEHDSDVSKVFYQVKGKYLYALGYKGTEEPGSTVRNVIITRVDLQKIFP